MEVWMLLFVYKYPFSRLNKTYCPRKGIEKQAVTAESNLCLTRDQAFTTPHLCLGHQIIGCFLLPSIVILFKTDRFIHKNKIVDLVFFGKEK